MKLEHKFQTLERLEKRFDKLIAQFEDTSIQQDFIEFRDNLAILANKLRIEETMKRNMYQPIINILDKFMTYRQIEDALNMTHESVIYHMNNLAKLKFIKQEFQDYRLGTTKRWIRTTDYLFAGDIKKLQAQNSTTQAKLKKGLPVKNVPIPMDVITKKTEPEKQTYGARIITPDSDPHLRKKHIEASQMRRAERQKIKTKVFVGSTFDMM